MGLLNTQRMAVHRLVTVTATPQRDAPVVAMGEPRLVVTYTSRFGGAPGA